MISFTKSVSFWKSCILFKRLHWKRSYLLQKLTAFLLFPLFPKFNYRHLSPFDYELMFCLVLFLFSHRIVGVTFRGLSSYHSLF